MLSLIVPVYKNETGIAALLAAVSRLHRELGGRLEAVVVVDGSPDGSLAALQAGLVDVAYPAQLIALSRNFGSFAAIRCGLKAARGDTFAVMAADLQEPPELVVQMHRLLARGDVDVVVGERRGRADALRHRLASQIFWGLYRRALFAEIPPGGVDIFACSRAVRRDLLRLREHNSSLVAQLFWLGYRRATVPYARRRRVHGTSAWTFARKLKYLSDSIFSFTDLPIRALLYVGASVSVLAGCCGGLVVARRTMGLIDVSGYSATVLAIIFFGAVNLTATGLVGAYAWRAFENSKARPLHLVRTRQRFGPPLVGADRGRPAVGASGRTGRRRRASLASSELRGNA